MTQKIRNLALAAVAAFTMTSAAQAAVVISNSTVDTPLPADHFLVQNFDGVAKSGYDLSLSSNVHVFDAANGASNAGAPPPGTNDHYLVIQPGGTATLTALNALTSLSIYMGSPDDFNSIRFIGLNGFDVTLSGSQLANGAFDFDGDRSIGRRLTYNFGDDRVKQVIFSSQGYSFELDNIAVSAVPEPGTWALMIAGFGMLGAALRRRPAMVRAAA